MKLNGDVVTLENRFVLVKLKIGHREAYINNVKFVLCHEIQCKNEVVAVSRMDVAKVFDPVFRPNYISGIGNFQSVILDPRQGGSDPGVKNKFGTEAAFALSLANIIKSRLEKRGFAVYLTQTITGPSQ